MSKIKTDSTQYKDMFLNNEKHLGQNKKMFVSMLAAEWLFFCYDVVRLCQLCFFILQLIYREHFALFFFYYNVSLHAIVLSLFLFFFILCTGCPPLLKSIPKNSKSLKILVFHSCIFKIIWGQICRKGPSPLDFWIKWCLVLFIMSFPHSSLLLAA